MQFETHIKIFHPYLFSFKIAFYLHDKFIEWFTIKEFG